MAATTPAVRAMWIFAAIIFMGAADANTFLERLAIEGMPLSTGVQFERDLQSEIEEVVGRHHRLFTEKRLAGIMDALRPMFSAMPKNEYGNLGHAGATYTLHRLFVYRHAWFVTGLQPAGGAWAFWNSSSPTAMLKDQAPARVLDIFEERAGGRGLGLHDLSVLAATLEHLVHEEAEERLKAVYRAHNFTVKDTISKEEAEQVLEIYMGGYITNEVFSEIALKTVEEMKQIAANLQRQYAGWNHTRLWLKSLQQEVSPRRDYFSYADVANVVEVVGERYGRWQDDECVGLRRMLLEIEDPRHAGHVRVADFYWEARHNNKRQFQESLEYLRALGALDETDPAVPRVIVPNYMNSPSNCVASSNFFDVCCIDLCEELFGGLERELGAPDASPEEIVAAVAVGDPPKRDLSAQLLRRLHEISEVYDGRVQLHGRLFAQWMHQAYPRECPYPHNSGTTHPLRTTAFTEETGLQWAATLEDMERFAAERIPYDKAPADGTQMRIENEKWSMEEELVVWRPPPPMLAPASASWATVQSFALLSVAVSVGGILAGVSQVALHHGHKVNEVYLDKLCV